MNFTKAALTKFLHSTKLNKKASSFVLGNESGDLDSSIGSIIYSFYISLKNKQEDSPVPILNYKSADFSLRPELVAVLGRVNIPQSSLTFIDDLNFSEIKIDEIRLVDHNKLINSQLFLKDHVTEVIDHHFDESNYLPNLKQKKILTVGSVCTLIAEICLEEGELKDEEIARLLLSVILSDTYNLHPGDRTTEKDLQIANELAKIIDSSKPASEIFNEVFQFVDDAKSSVDSLSTIDLLRKDYKLWEVLTKSNKNIKMGIASAPISFTKFINREDTVINRLSTYSQDNQLDVLFVMLLQSSGTPQRQLILFTNDDKQLFDQLNEFLFTIPLNPSKIDWPIPENQKNVGNIAFYETDVKYSRKVFSPEVTKYLESL